MKAFTLIELLISMIITCVVIFFAYMFLDTSGRLIYSYKVMGTGIVQAWQFTSTLVREANQYPYINFDSQNQQINMKGEDIRYQVAGNKIVRIGQNSLDTFKTGNVTYIIEKKAADSVNTIGIFMDENDYLLSLLDWEDARQQIDDDEFLTQLRDGRDQH